ncbi:MAG: hypothetical protein IRZ16_06405 [Myxococcaceae bacterium]|nr:hypothetical protein [Myxococcaceae bacterium]
MFAERVLGLAAGPEAEIVSTIKRSEGGELRVDVPGAAAPLIGSEHHYDRLIVDWEKGSDQALATATLDFVGTLGKIQVSSLGLEKVPFVRRDGDWRPSHGPAPRLAAIVTALEARRRALESGDVAELRRLSRLTPGRPLEDADLVRLLSLARRSYRVESWWIRSERDEVIVTEESRLSGETPDRPVDERRTRRLLLREDGGEFLFAAGLM